MVSATYNPTYSYLCQLPNCPQCLDLVADMSTVLQALVADGQLVLHAVHSVVLQHVLGAGGDLAWAEVAPEAATWMGPLGSGRQQAVHDHWAPWWVAAQVAGLAVGHVELLAVHGVLEGTLHTGLAVQGTRQPVAPAQLCW